MHLSCICRIPSSSLLKRIPGLMNNKQEYHDVDKTKEWIHIYDLAITTYVRTDASIVVMILDVTNRIRYYLYFRYLVVKLYLAACPKEAVASPLSSHARLKRYLRTYSSHHATTTSTLTSLYQRLNTISPNSDFDRDLSMCVVIGNKISLLDTNIRTATHEAPWTSPLSASPR